MKKDHDEATESSYPEPLTIPAQSPLIDRDIVELVTRHKIIEPFESKLLSGCSYDLRVGTKVDPEIDKGHLICLRGKNFTSNGGMRHVSDARKAEFQGSPLFGYVNKHSVLARGIVHPITKVDPGFTGPLAVTIFNHGGPPREIQLDQPIVSLIIYPLHAVPDRIYGETQTPTTGREGSLEIAGVIDEPPGPVDDTGLARMYGRPVSRLYERVTEIEKFIEQLRKKS